jgi:hypothetical protein
MRNSYDLCKILKISPIDFERMSVSQIRYYIDMISADIKGKDPWITPQKISL